MSRSNPTANNPHPCQRWYEWNGTRGDLSYYDKTKKETVTEPLPCTFIWLDQTSAVTGWHGPSQSGIYSNEVRDTKTDPLLVKAFKGGELAYGLYSSIRDKIGNIGGDFTANIYMAFRENGVLRLGCIQLKRKALNAWLDFHKENFAAVGSGAVTISGFKEGKKGSVTFRVPVFSLTKIKEETNEEATSLDKTLQAHLQSYFARTKADQVLHTAPVAQPPLATPAEPAQPTDDTSALDAEADAVAAATDDGSDDPAW